MPFRITCPGCKTSLRLNDDARGTKIRCDECDKAISIPAVGSTKIKAAPAHDEDEQDEERPSKKKKKKGKKSASSSPVLLIAGAAVVVVLLLGVGGVSAFFLFRSNPAKQNQQAKLDQKDKKDAEQKDQQANGGQKDPKANANADAKDNKNENPGIRIAPKIEEGSPTKKGGTGIVQNVRGAIYRTERKSELKQLGLAFNQFCDEYKGANRTYENFLASIKTFGPIVSAVKDGYYKINMNARLEGSSIIAYERDKDHAGYLCVMGDGDVRFVSEPEWKTALGMK